MIVTEIVTCLLRAFLVLHSEACRGVTLVSRSVENLVLHSAPGVYTRNCGASRHFLCVGVCAVTGIAIPAFLIYKNPAYILIYRIPAQSLVTWNPC